MYTAHNLVTDARFARIPSIPALMILKQFSDIFYAFWVSAFYDVNAKGSHLRYFQWSSRLKILQLEQKLGMQVHCRCACVTCLVRTQNQSKWLHVSLRTFRIYARPQLTILKSRFACMYLDCIVMIHRYCHFLQMSLIPLPLSGQIQKIFHRFD